MNDTDTDRASPAATAIRAILDTGSEEFSARLAAALDAPGRAKRFNTDMQAQLDRAFVAGADTEALLHARAALVDVYITALWQRQGWDDKQRVCMLAVGGYGRAELHPHSDVDIVILLDKVPNNDNQECIARFVTQLWDSGFELGHSVRTVKECVALAAEDITIMTNLLESRQLFGDVSLHEKVVQQTSPERMWPAHEFFTAKWQEQRDRHRHVD
ncbi:MAG: DUF294 nucleotidyltransferase-like domain-containing protein, partial [Pseudomonadales bacterium]